MVTAQEFWRPIINDFQPVGPVRPEDVRRFFVDRHEADPTRSLVQQLKSNLLNSLNQPKPYQALLTGHVGSGKSTELIKLGEELVPDFFIVRFDAEFSLSPETANHFDVLLGMGLAVHKAAQAAELYPSDKLTDKLVKSMAKFIRKYENRKGFTLKLEQLLKSIVAAVVGAGIGSVGGPAGAAVGAAFGATRLELNVSDEHIKTLELPPNRQEVMGAFNEIIAFVQKECGRPVLIIMDGLDKAPASRAQLLSADSALLTEPACAVVYTAPIEFYHRLAGGQARNLFNDHAMLPNTPVQKRPPTGDYWQTERHLDQDGLAMMRKVVAKRLEVRGKTLTEVVTPAALDSLARMSGGVMREMVRYFQDAARFAQLLDRMHIDEGVAQRVINQRRQAMAAGLDFDHRQALQHVLRQGMPSGGSRQAVEEELLRSLYLLSYEDVHSNFWYDAHPNVLPLL